MVSGLDGRVRALEGAIITQSVTATQKIEAAFARIDEHTKQISTIRSDVDCLEDRIAKAESIVSAVKWVGGIFAAMVAALIWGILTHQIEVVFK